jgi:hypothetical protein
LENKFCSGCLQSFSDDQLFEIEGQYYCKYCLPDRAPAFEEEEASIDTPIKINKIFTYSYFFLHVLIVFVLIPITYKYGVKSSTIWWILIILNIPIAVTAIRIIFPTSKEFNKGLWYFFTPESLLPFSQNYHEDRQYSFLFAGSIVLAFVIVLMEYAMTVLLYDFIYCKYIF